MSMDNGLMGVILILGVVIILFGVLKTRFDIIVIGFIMTLSSFVLLIVRHYFNYLHNEVDLIDDYQKSKIVIGSSIFLIIYSIYRLFISPSVDMDGKQMNHVDIPYTYLMMIIILTFSELVPSYVLE